MSKKVNIMADVDQAVYDAVVVPHKQSRTFTSLIETLLMGYYSNAYIRSFVDDELEGIQHESSDVLNGIINNMHKGLANMGVYTEEMKSNSQDGIDAFSKKAEETKKEMNDLQSKELQDVKESVELLKSQNEEIMGMLKAFMSGGAVAQPMVQMPVSVVTKADEEEDVLLDFSEDNSTNESEGVSVVEESKKVVEETKDEEEVESESVTSEEEALAIMQNLLEGNEFAF